MRKYIDPSKITNPTFLNDNEAGCQKDRSGLCPMQTNVSPSEVNGCKYCNKVKNTWDIREKVLSIIDEQDLQSLNYYDLDDIVNKELKEILDSSYENSGYLQPGILLDHVKLYCSFEKDVYSIRVENKGEVISEGRHRLKIARNMGICIPVHWIE